MAGGDSRRQLWRPPTDGHVGGDGRAEGYDGTEPSEAAASQAAASWPLMTSSDLAVQCRNTFLECPPIADWLDPDDACEILSLRLGTAGRRADSAPPALPITSRQHDDKEGGSRSGHSSATSDPSASAPQSPEVRKLRLCKSKRERFHKALQSMLAKAESEQEAFVLHIEELPKLISESPFVYAEFRKLLEERLGRAVAFEPLPEPLSPTQQLHRVRW